MSTLPYVVPETSPDYEADDINDALRAAAERNATCATCGGALFRRRCGECNAMLENGGCPNRCLTSRPSVLAPCPDCRPSWKSSWLADDDAEERRVEASRVPCAKCRIYTVAAEGDTCSACDDEKWGERCDFNDDGHEVMR
jgi:hypothetical protein